MKEFAFFPKEWFNGNNGGSVLKFQVVREATVDLFLRFSGINQNSSEEIFAIQGEYCIGIPKVQINEHLPTLSFTGEIGAFSIPPKNTRNFSLMAKKRWETNAKRRNLIDQINLNKSKGNFLTTSFHHDENDLHVNASTQTLISGKITDHSYSDDSNLSHSKPEMLSILWEMLGNCFKQQRRYDDTTFDISMLLYLTSAKNYILLRQIFPLPAITNLYQRFGENIKSEKGNLTQIEKLESIIKTYVEEYGCFLDNFGESNSQQFCGYVTLGIDAFAFRSFSTVALTKQPNPKEECQENVVFNNGFIFMLVPLDYRLPPKILHIKIEKNGNYNDKIKKIADTVRNVLQSNGFRVWFKATDGDRYLSSEHSTFFDNYINGKSSNYLNLIKDIWMALSKNSNITIPIGDPLHLWKNIRSRFLKYQIALFADSPFTTDIRNVRDVLGLGKALTDITPIGKMRDIYVMQIFTFNNVKQLMSAGDYLDATFLLPFACWVTVIFSTKIDLQFRIFLTELAFQIISVFRQHLPKLGAKGIRQKVKGKIGIMTLTEDQYLKRMLNNTHTASLHQ